MESKTSKKTAQRQEEEPYVDHYNEIQTFLEWTAPGRPFKKRGKTFYATSLTILFFVEVILFLFSQYILMLVAISFVFVSFVLSAVPPQIFHYRISTEGIFVEDHFYLWQELYDFYFKHQDGEEILFIRTHFLPGLLVITLGSVTKEEAKRALLPFLPFREYVKPTLTDKATDWMVKNFPLDRPEKK